jgi:hypothetical protein
MQKSFERYGDNLGNRFLSQYISRRKYDVKSRLFGYLMILLGINQTLCQTF